MVETLQPWRRVAAAAVRCGVVTLALLARRRLHLRTDRRGATVVLPDGRRFRVFRETRRDAPHREGPPVLLSVWFHLRGVPAGARRRRRAFERLSIVNTVLFAGFDGFRVKLWMVDPGTSDYAGLYAWSTAEGAHRYGRYIAAVLAPVSVPGSIGYEVREEADVDSYVHARTA